MCVSSDTDDSKRAVRRVDFIVASIASVKGCELVVVTGKCVWRIVPGISARPHKKIWGNLSSDGALGDKLSTIFNFIVANWQRSDTPNAPAIAGISLFFALCQSGIWGECDRIWEENYGYDSLFEACVVHCDIGGSA